MINMFFFSRYLETVYPTTTRMVATIKTAVMANRISVTVTIAAAAPVKGAAVTPTVLRVIMACVVCPEIIAVNKDPDLEDNTRYVTIDVKVRRANRAVKLPVTANIHDIVLLILLYNSEESRPLTFLLSSLVVLFGFIIVS